MKHKRKGTLALIVIAIIIAAFCAMMIAEFNSKGIDYIDEETHQRF